MSHACRRASASSSLLGVVVLLVASASGQSPGTEWIDRSDPEEILAGATAATEAMAAASARDYLAVVGGAFFAGRPALAEADRLRCVRIHLPLLRTVARNDGRLGEWFGLAAATYLAGGNQLQGALEVLDEVAQLLPEARDLLLLRCQLRIDCLVAAQQLAAAERACGECEQQLSDGPQRARLLAQRGSVNVMLGRLDLATEDLQRAADHLPGLAADPTTAASARATEFDLLLRRLDLFSAREQFDRTLRTIAEFERGQAAADSLLPPPQQQVLRVHAAAAAYHMAQHGTGSVAAAAERLAELRGERDLPPRHRVLATLWAADLALLQGRLDEARDLLALVDDARQPRLSWQRAPIAARLARLRGDDAGELAAHRDTLRGTLDEMIECWNEVAWDQESTGFLRLGARTRVLSELIAITLHRMGPEQGPEQALQHVLDVQCCTSISRARGVAPAPQQQVRERALAADWGALVFVPSWHESHLFVVDRSRVSHVLLPRARLLREASERLRTELDALREHPDEEAPDRAFAAAAELGELLLSPATLARVLGWRGLTITGNGLLGGAPLECVQLPDGKLLGERVAVATIGSLPLLAQLRDDAREAAAARAPQTVSLLAALMPGAGFAARNGIAGATSVARELQPLIDQLPEGADVRLDGEATVSAWRRDRAKARALTLLLAHGESPLAGRPAALGLTPDTDHPDGLLTPEQVQAMAHGGMIALAACDSANGAVRMGDDEVVNSLAGAFLRSGARSVIANTAPQRLRTSIAVLEALVAALRDGHCEAEALRRARVEVAEGDPALRLQLAQMTIVGSGDARIELARPAPRAWTHLLLTGILSFLLLPLLLLRRHHRRRRHR